ncbi:hypothetical protein BGZ76_007781 [Entomortierella beljakovae]|nr:hypothetical protein BGZ76_007781 [Entomortierella beljakovae]
MTRLDRKDNDVLRDQEWKLLFGAEQGNTSTLASTASHVPPLPPKYAQDTFLVKSFFSESNEKYYLILVTNLKQYWYEKLQIEDIRERSKKIKSFAYEEDSQLEALLLSLSLIFSNRKDSLPSSSSASTSTTAQRWIEKDKDKFGLSNVQWEFKLSPLLCATGKSNHKDHTNGLFSLPTAPDELLSLEAPRSFDVTQPAGDLFLDVSGDEGGEDSDSDSNEEDWGQDNNNGGYSLGLVGNKRKRKADGMSIMYDHLILPLISLTNTYHKRIKSLEAVIKAKENEVVEALEMLEQGGIGYQNRRKATEKYDKSKAEDKLQQSIERLTRPHVLGPTEIFTDKKIPELFKIISKNAANRDTPASSLERSTGSSQGISSLSQIGRGVMSTQAVSSSQPTQKEPATTTIPGGTEATSGNSNQESKAAKESEELERRRALREQLDKEIAAKERAPKKKKLF